MSELQTDSLLCRIALWAHHVTLLSRLRDNSKERLHRKRRAKSYKQEEIHKLFSAQKIITELIIRLIIITDLLSKI